MAAATGAGRGADRSVGTHAVPARTPGRHRIDNESHTDTFETTAAAPVSADLDPGYYERGVQARRRAHVATADVPGLVDEVEDRIEKLLQRTLNLLGDTFDDPF